MARNCEWHEKQFHASGGAVLKAMSEDPSAATSDLDIKDELALEVKMASKALQMQRKAKLRQLFTQEGVQYEAELNAMGLAIEKTRL